MNISIKYITLFLVLFAIEVIIATYIHDNFIRPYLGDTIVIVLIYAFVMGFFSVGHTLSSKIKVAFYVLLFAFIIEGLQASSFIYKIGLGDQKWAQVILGTSFSWWDIIAYIAGFIAIVCIEWIINKKKLASH